MNIRNLSLKEYGEHLRSKELSAREGVQVFFDAIEKEDKNIHAFLSLRKVQALEEAERIDEKIAQGEYIEPLAGIPVALKDNLLVEGEKTTAGSKMLEDYVASYDATVVKKIKTVGAIIVGKTNLDEFAMGASTENSAFGSTKNPHAPLCVPGGSSGGSAAAVSAGFAPLALGSDTGGSIRQPAAFCGVVGFKPSYGAVSRFGLIAMASSLDQIGPIARSVEDAILLFNTIEGDDLFDATSIGVPAFSPPIARVKGVTLGVPEEYFSEGVAPEIKAEVTSVIKKFETDGFTIKSVRLPHTKYALSTYYIIVPAEVSANLARFDAVRYPQNFKGFVGKTFGDLKEKYSVARGYGFGDETKRRILLGAFVLSAGHYDEYYKKAERVREVITREFDKVFTEVDVLIAPTTPTKAFKFGEKTDDPLEMYATDALTIPANLAGLPALSLPVKKYVVGSGELPIGFQIIGKPFEDRMVLALGDYYEKNLRE